MCTRLTMLSFARANDAKIVCSRDAQCNTEESLLWPNTVFDTRVLLTPFSKTLDPLSPRMAARKLTTQTLVL